MRQSRLLVACAAAGILAAALQGCDSSDVAVVEKDAATSLDIPEQQELSVQTGGAHKSGDPHAKLDPEQLATVALQHLDESRTGLALQTLDEALARFPDHAMLLSLRASIHFQNGQTSLALTDLNAQALRQFGRDQDARRDLDGAIEIDDRFVAAYFNRGSLSFEAGDYAAALADFDRCIEIEPAVAAAWFNRASTHEAMGKRELAIADLEHFLSLDLEDNWKQMGRDLLAQWQESHS
jgi:tetratricopeptide (TPR) repeat protein